jgi:hypothetical protein
VGVVWRERRAAFRASPEPGTKVWTFLESGGSTEPEEPAQESHAGPKPIEPTDPFHELVRTAIGDLVATGR